MARLAVRHLFRMLMSTMACKNRGQIVLGLPTEPASQACTCESNR